MANVIDTLIVELSLDASKFTAAQKAAISAAKQTEEAMLRHAKHIEEHGERMGHFWSHLKREALGFLAAMFGGREIKSLVENLTHANAALGTTAQITGVSARNLAAWMAVAERAGGSAEGMSNAVVGLTKQVRMAHITGDWGRLGQILANWNINVRKANGEFKDTDELLGDINAKMSKMSPQSALAFGGMLGFDDATSGVLMTNVRLMKEMLEEEKKIAANAGEDAKAAMELTAAWKETTGVAHRFASMIQTALTPYEVSILHGIRDALKETRDELAAFSLPAAWNKFIEDMKAHPFQTWWSAAKASAKAVVLGPLNAIPSVRHWAYGKPESNMGNFLNGLSWLESDYKADAKNKDSTATGAFQFTAGTRNDAMKAGLGDPWAGGFEQQKAVTEAFIRKFYPAAAAALDRGDYATASFLLRRVWPSLPFGGQSHAKKLPTFGQIVEGGGPRPPGGAPGAAAVTHGDNTTTSTTTITANYGPFNVHGARDPDTFIKIIEPALKRNKIGIPANTGGH